MVRTGSEQATVILKLSAHLYYHIECQKNQFKLYWRLLKNVIHVPNYFPEYSIMFYNKG